MTQSVIVQLLRISIQSILTGELVLLWQFPDLEPRPGIPEIEAARLTKTTHNKKTLKIVEEPMMIDNFQNLGRRYASDTCRAFLYMSFRK